MKKTIVNILKGIIEEKSTEFLKREPFKVYDVLIGEKVTPFNARLVLMTLLADTIKHIETTGCDKDELTRFIAGECGVTSDIATDMARVYDAIFGGEQLARLKEKELQGLEEFCRKSWEICADVAATWDCGQGFVSCDYSATIKVHCADKELIKNALAKELANNPYLQAEDIRQLIEEAFIDKVSDSFEDYVTAEPYYEPVVEDYYGNMIDEAEIFCKQFGLALESCDGEGSSSDFIPNY